MEKPALAAARALIPRIQALRDETESGRRLPAPLVDSLRHARLGRMAVVSSLGGIETTPAEMLEVYEALASAEASVAWIVWNNSLPCMLSRFLSPDARKEVFADPGWLYAVSTRPSGQAVVADGGYLVSGRWSLVSGCELADWIAFLCVVKEGECPRMQAGGPELRFFYVRRSDCRIIDTWHVSSLRGTGSHDVEVADLFVAEAHSALPGVSRLDAPLGRMPIISTMAAGFAAQLIGVGSAALATVVELAKTKVSPGPRPDLRDLPANQASLALHRAALAAARTHLYACVSANWNKAVNGEPVTLQDISTAWGAAQHAAQVGRQTLEAMFGIAGTTSLYTHCPLERMHRDMHAMMRHVVAQPFWGENAGRVMFGLEPEEPLFAL
jgi:alkylation response protein AidB-like acyl-CoA dehydrogenase